jgi:hypothetical protein
MLSRLFSLFLPLNKGYRGDDRGKWGKRNFTVSGLGVKIKNPRSENVDLKI